MSNAISEKYIPRKVQVLNWLEHWPGNMKLIEDRTGIKAGWIYAFKNGHIKNPGVDRIEALYQYMVADSEMASKFDNREI